MKGHSKELCSSQSKLLRTLHNNWWDCVSPQQIMCLPLNPQSGGFRRVPSSGANDKDDDGDNSDDLEVSEEEDESSEDGDYEEDEMFVRDRPGTKARKSIRSNITYDMISVHSLSHSCAGIPRLQKVGRHEECSIEECFAGCCFRERTTVQK